MAEGERKSETSDYGRSICLQKLMADDEQDKTTVDQG
jgi:hypothetical protein